MAQVRRAVFAIGAKRICNSGDFLVKPSPHAMAIPKTQHALCEDLPAWGVTVLESHHAPGFFMEPRRHDFLKVIYLLAGRGRIHLGEGRSLQAYDCQRGDIVVVPPKTPNQIIDQPGSPISLYACCIEPRLLDFDRSLSSKLPQGKLPASEDLAQQVERLLRRMRFQLVIPADTQTLRLVALSLDLLTVLLRERSAEPSQGVTPGLTEAQKLERYLQRLPAQFFEATTLEEAALQAGIPRRRFTELFRQRTGMSWLPYVSRLGIDHACRLLQETDLAVTSIAFECGFHDLSTFYRAFKKQTGMPPLEWRDIARQK